MTIWLVQWLLMASAMVRAAYDEAQLVQVPYCPWLPAVGQ